jgi:TPR repeat protein
VSTQQEGVQAAAAQNHPSPAQADVDIAQLEARAVGNDFEAIALLSLLYLDGGPGVPADFMKAYKYARQGAGLKEPASTYALARIQHRAGELGNALESARTAYQLGWPDAGVFYARMLLLGEGTAKAPLDAMSLLAELAQTHLEAALACAEELLTGNHLPKDPKRGYEVLVPHEPSFDELDVETRKHAYRIMAMALYRSQTRQSPLGRSGDDYVEAGAKLGDQTALDHLKTKEKVGRSMKRIDEWHALASFDAFGAKWEMFTKVGTLVRIDKNKDTSVHGFNGNVSTTTIRWNTLHFRGKGDDTFSIRSGPAIQPVTNRAYVLLYVGLAGSGSGVPYMMFDPVSGDTYTINEKFQGHYKKELSFWKWVGSWAPLLAGAYALVQSVPTLVLLFVGMFHLFLVGTLGTAVGLLLVKCGWTLRKRYQGNRKEALRKAGAFIAQYGRDLLEEG